MTRRKGQVKKKARLKRLRAVNAPKKTAAKKTTAKKTAPPKSALKPAADE
ncbi:MAG TPA: hypothetical protein VLT33_14135 [Labilithrix sp.]|nr:hypothetical protein [Labilithrix sp.]